MLYQLYHSLSFSTLILPSSLYLSVATWVIPQGHNTCTPVHPAIPYVQSLEAKRKEKKKNNKNEKNIDLVVLPSHDTLPLELNDYLSDWILIFTFLLYKNPTKLLSKGYSNFRRTWTFTQLGVNSLLHIFGVGFQLYGQLKYSLHEGMGVLGGSTAYLVLYQHPSPLITFLKPNSIQGHQWC